MVKQAPYILVKLCALQCKVVKLNMTIVKFDKLCPTHMQCTAAFSSYGLNSLLLSRPRKSTHSVSQCVQLKDPWRTEFEQLFIA